MDTRYGDDEMHMMGTGHRHGVYWQDCIFPGRIQANKKNQLW